MGRKCRMAAVLTGLLLTFPLAASAKEVPTVTFNGGSELVYGDDPAEELGDAFHDMLPGEVRSQEIRFANTSGKTVDFYMKTEVLKTLEAGQADGAYYEVSLVTEQDGKKNVLFGNDDGTPERIGGAGSQGLGKLNEELGTWLKTAELEPGNEAVLTFTVGLDGESTGNGYMDREAVFQYGFRAEYTEPETKETEKPPVKQVTARSVFTGDTANGAVWGIVLILAAGTAGAAAVRRKNGKNRTGE